MIRLSLSCDHFHSSGAIFPPALKKEKCCIVVRSKDPDFTPEAQRHQDEREIMSPVLPTEKSEEQKI